MKHSVVIFMVVVAVLSLPTTALAHLVNSGLGPFYDGALHLLLSPSDMLGLLAAALLAGLCGAKAGRQTTLILPAAWFVSGLIGLQLQGLFDFSWLDISSFAILGLVVAIDTKLPTPAVVVLAAWFDIIHGLMNGSALAAVGAGPISLLGIAVTVFITGLLISAFVISLSAAWMRVFVRVAGSWVAAVGMLMFGWMVKGTV